MFEEGNLLKFVPFLFKNGAVPKPKYFVVLKSLNGDMLLASLPTSKDHIPADMMMERGCLNVPERRLSIFVFLAGEMIAADENDKGFAFPFNTFIYGADIDTYPLSVFEKQIGEHSTTVSIVGKLQYAIFQELKDCLKSSPMVKNKFRRLL